MTSCLWDPGWWLGGGWKNKRWMSHPCVYTLSDKVFLFINRTHKSISSTGRKPLTTVIIPTPPPTTNTPASSTPTRQLTSWSCTPCTPGAASPSWWSWPVVRGGVEKKAQQGGLRCRKQKGRRRQSIQLGGSMRDLPKAPSPQSIQPQPTQSAPSCAGWAWSARRSPAACGRNAACPGCGG